MLSRGANRALPPQARRLRAVLSWDESEDGVADIDASALLLSADRRVLSDEHFVFYNQTASPDGAVRHLGRTSTEGGAAECVGIDLDEVGDDASFVVLVASVSDGTFGQVPGLRLVLSAGGEALAHVQAGEAGGETVLVLAELYRRGGDWKVRAVGQGWDSGLAGLAQDFGVDVADSDDEDTGDGIGQVPLEQARLQQGGASAEMRVQDVAVDEDDDLIEVVEPDEDRQEEPVASPGAAGAPSAAGASTDPAGSTDPADPADDAGPVAPVAASPPVTARSSAAVKGVRTRKTKAARAVVPVVPALRLRMDESWQSARVFSISGVGSGEEQEKRATSALLATMMGVRAFARGLTGHFDAPGGAVETYLETPFTLGEATVIPDGVIRIARAGREWTGLVEVKTGDGQLRRAQVENYLDVAREQGFDAVITISNEIAPGAGEHPVEVDRRKLRGKVALFHLSWAEVVHEAQMTLSHRGVGDALQAWLLAELIRYLQHPRSGAAGFEDMGPAWVGVREAVAAGTLRASDRKAPAVAESWIRLVRQLRLRLTAELGVSVVHVLPRRIATDPAARLKATTAQLAESGQLEATLRVPGAAGPVGIVADLRTARVRTSVRLSAPQEGGGQRRVSWLLRQLKDAPADLLIETHFTGRAESTCEQLRDVRDSPGMLLPDRSAEVGAFTLTRTTTMGTKRSGVKGAFIPSVTEALEDFYRSVVQPLRAWVPPAPKLPDEATGMPPADAEIDSPAREDDAGGDEASLSAPTR
ncbi:TerD family protein [Kineococcus sp. TRM81007]|uniref:TerD family protein n=1 Tax=Kineococcus sp. TRM81007 TaxID=2925831 RepID=UPI001F5993A2|nr:TerD family protein [Kineococcus sp. TRM81007]MCI2238009.1 TerD family protein [Kineococcus sp. TRM81007]